MSFSSELLKWHKKQNRHLPWQIEPSAYKIWISEIMLQQTVLSSVLEHYKKWMSVFPDVFILSGSSEKKVLQIWEGLGYYSRGRNILKTAKILVQQYDGKLPNDYETLVSLPGIGDYTASAILSMAYGQPYPVLDANVKRIGQRLLAKPEWNKNTQESVNSFFMDKIDSKQPGIFNEALMHFGQKICLKNPKCLVCPLQNYCSAFKNNKQNEIPVLSQRKTIVLEHYLVILKSENRVFLIQKSEQLLRGLWQFPKYKKIYEEKELLLIIKKEWYLKKLVLLKRMKRTVHTYTKYKDYLYPIVFKAEPENISKNWIEIKKLGIYPLPSVYRKILKSDYLSNT